MQVSLFETDDMIISEEVSDVVLTPIQRLGEIWVKREDLFNVYGANGAKARSCFYLVEKAKQKGYKLITTAGSRKSPQINIVAQICKHLDLKFVAHCPQGELGSELKAAQLAGAEIIQHKAGYNSVIVARAKTYAEENKGFEVPFGMMCREAVSQTFYQVTKIPTEVERIVIPVGSGMNLCGLLHGLKRANIKIKVLGVVVGANPLKTLNKFAPSGWENMVTLVNAGLDYHHEVKENELGGIVFDPIYEAKCIKFLQPKDLFWTVGIRSTLLKKQPLHSYSKLN
jgi:1-aminocyclopropane-1-carboxylate deaminase/D-cysteine desulfhydrase-like pyridoxal-dependent ACC family enzyme